MKLTEKAEEYNVNYGFDLIEHFRGGGFLKRDIIAGLNFCAELDSVDEGEEVELFIRGILWERKRMKEKKK